MLLGVARAQKMHDLVPACGEQVGHEQAVTSLRLRFRAHHTWPEFLERRCERLLPFPRAHPRRVASERGRSDAAEPLLAGLAASPAAELDRVAVRDASIGKRRGECLLVELRIASRARIPAYVDERRDAGALKTLDELVGGPGPVADRKDPHVPSVSESGPG